MRQSKGFGTGVAAIDAVLDHEGHAYLMVNEDRGEAFEPADLADNLRELADFVEGNAARRRAVLPAGFLLDHRVRSLGNAEFRLLVGIHCLAAESGDGVARYGSGRGASDLGQLAGLDEYSPATGQEVAWDQHVEKHLTHLVEAGLVAETEDGWYRPV